LAFDECVPYPTTKDYARQAMERTHRWAKRSYSAHRKRQAVNAGEGKSYQALYGIIQGSVFRDLRRESSRFINSMDFDGIAIGGVAVGESKQDMVDVLNWTTLLLPEEKPRHLLGVGEIDDVFALVERGIDTFDCVQPTRLARMGHLLIIGKPALDIAKQVYAQDTDSIDKSCRCYTCKNFSRAYLHHLFRVRELLVYRLATIHNLSVMNRLMADIRRGIWNKKLQEVKAKWLG
jgi:tRNA-guanine transglycosylase